MVVTGVASAGFSCSWFTWWCPGILRRVTLLWARLVAFALVIALLPIAPSGCVSRASVLPLAKE